MNSEKTDLKEKPISREDFLWELLVATRLYVIALFFIPPLILITLNIGYLSPVNIVIIGFTSILILIFVLFEPRTDSLRFLRISLRFIVPCAVLIFANFAIGLVLNIIHVNIIGIIIDLCIVTGSIFYFLLTIPKNKFKKVNIWLVSRKEQWCSKGTRKRFKKHIFAFASIFWLITSILIIILPYPVFIQNVPTATNEDGRRVGIWGFSYTYVDPEKEGSSRYFNDSLLEMISDANIYFEISIKKSSLGDDLEAALIKCRDFDIDVHLSIGTKSTPYKYVNIWTYETLSAEIDEILVWLDSKGFILNPVTTIIYDMEPLMESFIQYYGFFPNVSEQLRQYYTIEESFLENNQRIRDDYDLDIEICTEYGQGFDAKDGDDDIIANRGLLSDEKCLMSYMVYRRDNVGRNHILDHCRFLESGDTIILNAWKFPGYHCWEDINCAITDARIVLGYPGKTLNVEIWTLQYFLDSYGIQGLFDFVEGVSGDWTEWEPIAIHNIFEGSPFWDIVFYGTVLLDVYGPFFRVLNNAF